jgi:hypothetical protein
MLQKYHGGRAMPREAELILKSTLHNIVVLLDIVKSLLAAGFCQSEILVVSFYSDSVHLIARSWRQHGISVDVECASVDSS